MINKIKELILLGNISKKTFKLALKNLYPNPVNESKIMPVSDSSRRGVAFRSRHSTWPMLPVEEALSLITKSAASHPLKTATLSTIPPTLEGQAPAHSHVTGSLVLAREDLPNYRASIKDGYAVVSGDGPGVYQVVAVSKMGHNSGIVLESGTVSRVTTGIISHMFPGLPQVLLVTCFHGYHRYY